MSLLLAAKRERLERFTKLGLRWNPYRIADADESAELYVPPELGLAMQAREIVDSKAMFTQILAPCGWGKSTLLAAVCSELDRLEKSYHFFYLQPDEPNRLKISSLHNDILLLDEAQRLSSMNRQALFRWCNRPPRRLIVSSHSRLDHLCTHMTVTINIPAIDGNRLQQMFVRRIEWAGGDPSRLLLEPYAADWLIQQCRRNVRSIEAALYELFQTIEPSEQIVIDISQLERLKSRIDRIVDEAARHEALHD